MSTAGAAPPIASSPSEADDSADRVVVVYTCTRLGRTANPPGFSLLDFLRLSRFRRR